MALLTTSRHRRLASTSKQATRQLITFQLRQEWCALPINAVEKVVMMGKVYGDPQQTGVSVTSHEGRELLVVDVGHRIFGESYSDMSSAPVFATDKNVTRFLLVVRDDSGQSIGLPIDSAPAVRRVPVDSVSSLPSTYQAEGSLRCVSSLAVDTGDAPPIFVLDTSRLCQVERNTTF